MCLFFYGCGVGNGGGGGVDDDDDVSLGKAVIW